MTNKFKKSSLPVLAYRVFIVVLFISTFQTLKAQEMQDSIFNLFEANIYKGLPYQLLKPVNFDAKKQYPVILSLHGSGGKGTDNSKQIKDSKWINYLAKKEVRIEYPAYIIVPQTTELWNETDLSNIKEIIKNLPSADTRRIYVMGHSMGGHGTYRFIQFDTHYFAAAAPSAGSGLAETEDFIDVSKIKDIPIWVFHGDIDPKCPYEKDVKVFDAMQKIGGNMKFTTWKGDKHGGPVALKMVTGSTNGTTQNSSSQCDPEPVFLKWLFKQILPKK